MATVRLGDVLLRMGVITAPQLEQAMALQARHKVRLGQILADHGFCSEERVVDALAQVSSIPRLDMLRVAIDPAASRWITKEWAEQHMTIPIAVNRGTRALTVAISDPTDVAPIDELAFRTGLKIQPVLGSDRELLQLHRHIFHGAPLTRGKKAGPRPGTAALEDAKLMDEPELLYGMEAVRDHLHTDNTQKGTTRAQVPVSVPPDSPAAPASPVPAPSALADTDALLVPRLRALLDLQQDSARELQILFELCVARGIIQRAEYLARLERDEA